MKATLNIFILTSLIFLSACNADEVERLEKQNQMLRTSQASQDSLINDYLSAFNIFEENLETIKERESVISEESMDTESQNDNKEKILNDISAINDLLLQNQQIINDLNSRLDRTDGDQSQLRRLISRLEAQLVEKDEQIAVLKTNLEEMNFTAESLNRRLDTMSQAREQLVYLTSNQQMRLSAQDSTIEDQSGLIDIQDEALNTGFYVTGSARDLKESNVITTEGGFIGIGGSKVLRSDFNQDAFTQIDITKTDEIVFDEERKVRVVTYHPSDAYKLHEEENRITSLEILNPEKFWKVSKYLVVVTN